MNGAAALNANALVEISPLLRRVIDLDPMSVVRLQLRSATATALVRLPFGVLVGRRIPGPFSDRHDGSYLATDLLAWLDDPDQRAAIPAEQAAAWRGGVPPDSGWRRIETVPGDVIHGLVRQGALTLKEAADREGRPGATPRAEVADALLDSNVLTITNGDDRVDVSLRKLSALVRMGFLGRDSHLTLDAAGRWIRLAAAYGSVYAEREGLTLDLARPRTNPHGGVGR